VKQKLKILDEVELVDDLQPSGDFADLIDRIGSEVGIGNLGMPAFQGLVKERAKLAHEAGEAAPNGSVSSNG
jgi:hypothetical protein